MFYYPEMFNHKAIYLISYNPLPVSIKYEINEHSNFFKN